MKKTLICKILAMAIAGVATLSATSALAQGGSDALDNLQTLCVDCNRGKRNSSE